MTDPEVSRRRMLGAAVGAGVVVAAGVAGYLVADNSSAARKVADAGYAPAGPPPPAPTVSGSGATPTVAPLAAVSQIPDGGGLILGRQKLVLTRSGDTVHCFSAVCTHQQCTVGSVEGGRIICPCHGSQFDVNTGAVVAGPAPSPLPPVAVTVQDGEVFPG